MARRLLVTKTISWSFLGTGDSNESRRGAMLRGMTFYGER